MALWLPHPAKPFGLLWISRNGKAVGLLADWVFGGPAALRAVMNKRAQFDLFH